jgi:BirA family biotin operon repressor/biotin-[acetyl-CoA-carboxylase] ligase
MPATAVPPPGWRLRIEESLPSTSDLLLRLAAAGEPERLAVLARRQTGGRGRDGRAWDSPAGNLYVSVLLRPASPAREAGQWGLLSAVALHDALSPFLPRGAPLTLKWPNDLLLGGAKIAGMLCETAADARGGIEWMIAGLGANLAVAPAVPGRATACVGDHGVAPTPEAVAVALLHAFDHWGAIRAREGFAPIRRAWMDRGPRPDEKLAVRGGISGHYAGLAEDGSLLLARDGRVHAVAGGEIGGEAG